MRSHPTSDTVNFSNLNEPPRSKLTGYQCRLLQQCLKQRGLAFVYLLILIFPALVFHVISYCTLWSCAPYGIDEVSVCPEFPTPQLFLHFRVLTEYFSSVDTFDCLHDVFWKIHGYRLHKKMHMIFVGTNFKKMDAVAFGNLKASVFDCLVYCVSDYYPAICCWTHNVVD